MADRKTIPTPLLEHAAAAAHEVNRLYCFALGDFSQEHWDEAPNWQRESAIVGVRAVITGAGPEALHESWMRQKLADGWVHGEVKDPDAKTHPCLLPYADLPAAQRVKDTLFHYVVTAYLRAVGVL
jgi:hypothetical protein